MKESRHPWSLDQHRLMSNRWCGSFLGLLRFRDNASEAYFPWFLSAEVSALQVANIRQVGQPWPFRKFGEHCKLWTLTVAQPWSYLALLQSSKESTPCSFHRRRPARVAHSRRLLLDKRPPERA